MIQCYESLQLHTRLMMVLCSYGHVPRPWYGQVCFPGGMVEENTDHNIIDTSLREMEEEIGTQPFLSVLHRTETSI